MLSLEILRFSWWLLIGVLFTGFAVTDGWDLGAAILLPFIAKNDIERRIVINSIGPYWEGNQVWIILGAGAILAAWPIIYAVAFSSLYLLILLLLLTLGIMRPGGFKYRGKLPNPVWRSTWDAIIFIGGFAPALIIGILVGNVIQGISFQLTPTLNSVYQGSFLSLFSPFPLFCGLVCLMMMVMHGGLYVAVRTLDPVRRRAIYYSRLAAICLIILFALGGIWVAKLTGYVIQSNVDHVGFSNPLNKQVVAETGAWLKNYSLYPITLAAPSLGLVGALLALLTANYRNSILAFIFSGVSLAGIIGTVGVSLFPFILPSSFDPNSSLLIWDASSSQLTLTVMLVAVLIFVPLILLYTGWVFYALRGKVEAETVTANRQAY